MNLPSKLSDKLYCSSERFIARVDELLSSFIRLDFKNADRDVSALAAISRMYFSHDDKAGETNPDK